MSKRALVMGGTSFFGKRLVSTLMDNGYQVTVASRGRKANPFGDRVEQVIFNRTSLESMQNAFDNRQFELVYDQIGFAPDDAADAVEVFKGKIGRYVFTSTAAVYTFGSEVGQRWGGPAIPGKPECQQGNDLTESEFDPMSIEPGSGRFDGLAYDDGKRRAEAYLFQNAPFPVAAARMPMIVGPDDVTGRFQFHVQRIMQRLPILVPDPCGKMSFLHADDAGRFIAWLGMEAKSGPYNAVSNPPVSAIEVIEKIGAALGVEPVVVREATENLSSYYVPCDVCLNASKAESEGFRFMDFDEWIGSTARELAATL